MRTAKFDLINLHYNPRELGREKRAEEELDLREFKRRKRSREDGREMKLCMVMFSGELASTKRGGSSKPRLSSVTWSQGTSAISPKLTRLTDWFPQLLKWMS